MKEFAINSLWLLLGVSACGLSAVLITSLTMQIIKIFKGK